MPSMVFAKPLPPAQLCRRCPPAVFAFDSTAELVEQSGFAGQHRAQDQGW